MDKEVLEKIGMDVHNMYFTWVETCHLMFLQSMNTMNSYIKLMSLKKEEK